MVPAPAPAPEALPALPSALASTPAAARPALEPCIPAAPLPEVRRSDGWLIPILRTLVDGARVEELLAQSGTGLWRAVVASGAVTEPQLIRATAEHLRIPLADFTSVSRKALDLVPERWARKFQIVPLALTEGRLIIATADPHDLDCERTLAFATGRSIVFALAARAELARRIDELYRVGPGPADHTRLVEIQHLTVDHEAAPPTAGDESSASITHLVDEILGEGVAGQASDIHIEPEERGIAIRHRVDGVLRLVRILSRAVAPALVSRIKILSGLDIADRLRPQDGRARVAVNGVAVDLRVSTLPASHGEKVVIRVLDGRATVLALDGMGFNPNELARIDRLLQSREGLILVTGPTGSGKTTTLYAALRKLKERGVNIVTVEDPIEYRLPGIVQVQVHERAGLTFASALRSIMRQDPDVLLIGEIRDRETAEIALQASLTGHLVLSTLHTNDAASAVTRLIDIGVASYKIATAVKGVIAQRLVRRLCSRCRKPDRSAAESSAAAGLGLLPGEGFVACGCLACVDTGYRGRLAIVEVLIASPEFERRVAAGESADRIAAAGRADGMATLWHSGLDHVRRGDTSALELLRVAAPDGRSPPDSPPLPVHAATVSEHLLTGDAFTLRSDLDDGDADPRLASERVDDAPTLRYLQPRSLATPPDVPEQIVAQISIGTIDVYVIRPLSSGWQVLVLQRGPDTRCPTAWETVHGHLDVGEEPEVAALREVREESGLEVDRLYNVTVQPFYLHRTHTVELAVVFAAFVKDPAPVTLGPEHQRHEWLSVEDALGRFHWPRERAALVEISELLKTGDAGPVEDVLRVR
jgi:type II secretory ATPase GspE/PulE/Tfp pilus assembly ATPase PilB-like protein/8-oxo-dGTP pyrophosphatase MutT (NUDIX family)